MKLPVGICQWIIITFVAKLNAMTEQEKYWQDFDEAFFKDGYQLCDIHLVNGFKKENVFAAQRKLYETIDGLIASFLSRSQAEGKPSSCKMGCSYCCHQTVLAAPYELLYLADFLKRKFKPEALELIKERAEAKYKNTGKLGINKLLNFKQACPLLHPTGGFCRAYQARPMACRIYLSESVESCKLDLDNPDDDTIFPALYNMPLRAGRMLNEGFQARLRKGRENSLQAFENTIEEGVLEALKANSFEKWMAGQKVFRKIV